MCMQSITSNIFKLIKIFIDIINNKYYMVVGAKYDSSIINDACTTSPVNIDQPPCKSRMANHILFEKESDFCTAFVLVIS